MRVWTILLSLAVACLMAVNAPAQGTKKHALRDRFEKMDTNHNGILTMQEFAAGHPKLDATKAATVYKELVTLGGATTKNGVTGMTFAQFKKAHKAWKAAHPKQG